MMTSIQLEGMTSRAAGSSANPYSNRTPEHIDWRRGYDTMDDQIRQTLDNARSMLNDIGNLRRSQSRLQAAKG